VGYEAFTILVSDRDATVGVISAMLLSSALATERRTFDAKVRVLIEPEIITGLETPELPEEIRKIEEEAISATAFDIENANLIVSFSGIDLVKLDQIREIGVAAPAVNLCQFVDNLEALSIQPTAQSNDVRDVVVGAALQFGFDGGSSNCSICEPREANNIDYWLGIADTCSRFAQTVHEIRSQDVN
jgi:hypothetical protein